LLILIRVLLRETRGFTAIFHFVAKWQFQQFRKLKFPQLLQIKEHLESATKIALLILTSSFVPKLACLSLSGLTRQSILYLTAPQQVARLDEIKFLGSCSRNEP